MTRRDDGSRPREAASLRIPVGEATELPTGFGMLMWQMLDDEQRKGEQRRDDPDAWALEPLHR